MKLDDRICYCFHVSLRKLVHFARRERPSRATQMSNCLGAGTGCGWCIPMLKLVHGRVLSGGDFDEGRSVDGMPQTSEEYGDARKKYLASDHKHAF